MKWSMLNPDEAVERHLKEHPELETGKNGKLFTELGVGMIAVCNTVPETEKNGVGYTDLKGLSEQAKLVKQYTGNLTTRNLRRPTLRGELPNGAQSQRRRMADGQDQDRQIREAAELDGQLDVGRHPLPGPAQVYGEAARPRSKRCAP